MSRELKNVSENPVTVVVFNIAGPRDGFHNAQTEFICVQPGETVTVNEYQYQFFLTDERDEKGFMINLGFPVLSPAFEEVNI